jgi:hypothetical protein
LSRVLACVLLCAVAAPAAADDIFTVPPALWDRPRSARAVLAEPAVRQAVELHLARSASRLVIHHGNGQEPLAQAEEFRAWLLALAIDAARVSLVNDTRPHEALKIEVVK